MFTKSGAGAKSESKREIKKNTKDCAVAGDLMMRFMDKNITEDGEKRLMAHVRDCAACGEDFAAYTDIMAEFSAAEVVIAAPEGFEACVMRKIAALGQNAVFSRKTALDNVILAAVGIFSALFGIGALLFLNKDAILLNLSQSETFSAYAETLAPFSAAVSVFAANASAFVSSALQSLSAFADDYKFVIIGVCVALFFARFAVKTRSNVAYADEIGTEENEHNE